MLQQQDGNCLSLPHLSVCLSVPPVSPSARVEAGQRRVLDEATRQRRLSRQLEALEKDNFQDDTLSSLPPPGPTARLPAFSETEEPGETQPTSC